MPTSDLSRGADALAGRKTISKTIGIRSNKSTTTWLARSNTIPEILPTLLYPPGRAPAPAPALQLLGQVSQRASMDSQRTTTTTTPSPSTDADCHGSPNEGSVVGGSNGTQGNFTTVPETPRDQWLHGLAANQPGYQSGYQQNQQLTSMSGQRQLSGSAENPRRRELTNEEVFQLQEQERMKRMEEWEQFERFRRESRLHKSADDDEQMDDLLDEDSDDELLRRVNNNLQRQPFNDMTNLCSTTPSPNASSESGAIPEWAGCTQDAIMKRMKAIDKDQLKDLGLKEFYKSYFSWEKMTNDQKNKTLSYFRALPEELQGMSVVLLLQFFF